MNKNWRPRNNRYMKVRLNREKKMKKNLNQYIQISLKKIII